MTPRGKAALILCLLFVFLAATDAPAQRRKWPLFEPDDPGFTAGAPNLFLEADVTASGQWTDRVPGFAVNGVRGNAGEHWGAENIPVWLTVDMASPRRIDTIRLFTYWDGSRHYRYVIEGSPDNEAWTLLVDRRDNKKPASSAGELFSFPPAQVRYVRTTLTFNSAGKKPGGHIVEIEGYCMGPEKARQEIDRLEAWDRAAPGLRGTFGSIDERYGRSEVPDVTPSMRWSGTAWRGERLGAQLLLYSTEPVRQVRLEITPFRSADGRSLGIESLKPRFVRYTLAEGRVTPDVLDDTACLDMAAETTRPVWISIEPPRDAEPGLYTGCLGVKARGGISLAFDLDLEVLPLTLPPPGEWEFHLDLWQNPFAVARYHHVEPWSPEFFLLLEPVLRMLAEAGQKCLTTSIIHQPWGGQTFDPFETMVTWTRLEDGSFSFDYSVFDRYVEFGAQCGLDKWINCYSMVPWTNRIRYRDAATGDHVETTVKPGEPVFEEFWKPFLRDFARHLRKKGWLERTVIAMDERPLDLMRPTIDLVRRTAPGLGIALAGHNLPALKDDIDDWCVFLSPPLDPAIVKERAARSRVETTFYVCCGPKRPNTFTFSPPAESAWMGLHAASQHYTGFLRWAYNSWVEEPLLDTNHVTWPAGDCFLVYPGPRSSIRFERLREGIQEYEKIRILRGMAGRKGMSEALSELDAALALFTYESALKEPAARFVKVAKRAIEKASRVAARE